jgi:hypothetical protein
MIIMTIMIMIMISLFGQLGLWALSQGLGLIYDDGENVERVWPT